jgi:2-oxoglutarate dehydrogenase E2 component (dihydrolipoamide succinyltransferase)
MRTRISQRLKESQNTAAMLTTFQECDMSALFEMREKYKEQFEKAHGAKLGFMSPFIKAAAMALQEQPIINAVIDGGDIVYRDYVDISVAVASPRGLVVPVLRNVEAQSLAKIEQNLADLAKRARADQIALEEMAGGTFTISNGGVFGSMMGTPIINPPQSAILGMHATKQRAVVVNGKIEVRPVMYLALTYDHRLIDGREAVTYLVSLRDKIEDPRRMLLGL